MKAFALQLFPVILFLFSISSIECQVAVDPITNIYKVGGSSEIFIGYSTFNNANTRQGVLDIPENLNDIVKLEDAFQYKFMDMRKTATATGDFNGDGADEIVTIRDNISGGIKISIPLVGEDLLSDGEKTYTLEDLNTLDYHRLRMCAGNFDRDLQDEFAICYGGLGETIRLVVFETDEDLNITLVDMYREIAYYDIYFDISAGDTDGDGMDEIAMVKNESQPYEANNKVNPPIFISKYDLYIFKFDTLSKEVKCINEVQNLEVINQQAPDQDFYNTAFIKEMRIACGDLSNDGRDEFVVGWFNYYTCYKVDFIKNYFINRNMVFLNTFRIVGGSGEIENVQNLCLYPLDNEIGKGYTRNVIALSLKCEKLDNLGRDEVLINSMQHFYVLGSTGTGMELEVKTARVCTAGHLNIGGNECFLVADLNPDTATMNFNKEVILLHSNKDPYTQTQTCEGVTSFQILILDTISADTVAFIPTDVTYSFPFGEANIQVTSFVTGDFNLDKADIYMIGTPEVIPVTQLQYPLVILNAPPVHFDVFNGLNYDLCDAFINDDVPAFSALYRTRVGEKNTTSVEVDNTMGFSSDYRAYAMAGGSGFEASVTSNWEKGKSFYQARSHNTLIEEEKEVYTEDFVLYSALDYRYYKYPIYNESREKIGDIAILNPESENFSSIWGSGNSWDHPGYVFNHEAGNILSYKPYMNTTDFCSRESDFSFYAFSRVPVTNTGNGSFNFSFENIIDEGNAYSYSGGTGADLFTKVGFEGTFRVNLGAFGIGGSVSRDVRIGVSCDVSSYFCSSRMSSHSIELSDAFQIDGSIGRLNESYDNVARYFITPYIYRSQSGALVLDYMVDLDESNKEWWVENYGSKPDLAFILPWRYAVEKGSDYIKPSKLQQTGEIRFYPPIVSPGDTVRITIRVHNYSLLKFENTLKVNYYLGDPEKGGIELTDINGGTGNSKFATLDYNATEASLDFEEYLSFMWQVPDTLSCSPRIYAVIDEGNEYDEIHEDNNTGWNKLNIIGCTACEYAENYIGIESEDDESFFFESYPNPAGDCSRIRFALPSSMHVLINVYNLSGQKVGTVADGYCAAGEQEVEFHTVALSDGIYFYKLVAGAYTGTARFVVFRH